MSTSAPDLRAGVALTLSEVMELLGYQDESFVDRKQFKRLLVLASAPELNVDTVRSRRYTQEEIAGAEEAIQLLKAQWQHESGKLATKTLKLERACAKLRDFGFTYPLTQTSLRWDTGSRSYIFSFQGFVVDAATGQGRIDGLLRRLDGLVDRQTALDAARIELRRREIVQTALLAEVRGAVSAPSLAVRLG